MSGAGPFGKEAALFIGVGEAFLHFLVHRRIHQVEEGEKAAEGVPKAGVGEHVAGKHFAVVGAVVHRLSVSADFIEAAGEKHRAVEAGIEGAQAVYVVVFNLDASEHLVPFVAAFLFDGVEIVVAEFAEVALSLFGAYEG